jgi:hypothetical protein
LILDLCNTNHSGGIYAIYKHKNAIGKGHLTSGHSLAGVFVVLGCIMSGIIGGVFLHPDFGTDKTNKQIRYVKRKSFMLFTPCSVNS